ncbi:hypothetical protein Q3G72_013680 [Acer saccharum]|nr:hypothetical protein Q3G72_013680 [Acer saccharum]
MENIQDVSIEPDGDNAKHRTEAYDIMPRTRSRTKIQECDDNGDGSQCSDPTSVGARYDGIEHARFPLREDPLYIQRDIGHHFTPLVDPIDPPSFTQDPSDIQQDLKPPMDPIDPPSFTQDHSDIQQD